MTYYTLTAGSAGAKKISCCESSHRVFALRCLAYCYMTKTSKTTLYYSKTLQDLIATTHDSATMILLLQGDICATECFFFSFFLFLTGGAA